MSSIIISKHGCGEWVTEWYGKYHYITFNPTDDLSFVSLGLLDRCAVRFEVNPRGVILNVYNNSTGAELTELTIPDNHALNRELKIGRPV